MAGERKLPAPRTVRLGAPLGWLAGGWRDFWRAWPACLFHGAAIAAMCAGLATALVASDLAYWAFILICGFVFVAPMLAMGPYELGRRLEAGERPTLASSLFVARAVRQDVAYLGLALLIIFFIWGQVAQIVYGLSTYQIHRTVADLAAFAFETADGRRMLLTGSVIGGVIAFLTFCLVVVAAPMLLDGRNSVFEAVATSVRAVNANLPPLLLWAALLAAFTLASALTGFAALVIVFPWLGLASWRAYRDLIPDD